MLRLQPDGNFVAYDTDNKPYWSSDKYFKDDQATYRNSILRVRKDGRVEIRLRDRDIFWITPFAGKLRCCSQKPFLALRST